MKAVAVLALLVALLPVAARALEEDGYDSIGALRGDFRKADSVVVIRPVSVSPDHTVKALGNVYCTKARVLERFKGRSTVGAAIEFCTVFEDKPNEFHLQSNRIVFQTIDSRGDRELLAGGIVRQPAEDANDPW